MIYLHGRVVNREWRFADERLGGNFNRPKNLIVAAGDLYVGQDFTDSEEKGREDIAGLVNRFAVTSREVVLTCGSMGGTLCWSLLTSPETSQRIGGAVFLRGFPKSEYASLGGQDRPPLFFAHGSDDPVYPVETMRRFYETLRAKGQPVRICEFKSGNRGTPVRMIDWRGTLNWLFAR